MIHSLLPKISMYSFGKVASAGMVIATVARTSEMEIHNSAATRKESRRPRREAYMK